MDFFNNLDLQLLLSANGHHTAFWDSFWMLFTGRFVWVPMYAAMLYALLRSLGWQRTLVAVVFVALVIAAADQLCGSLLRDTICRPRPSRPDSPVVDMITTVGNYRAGHYGFPSCHAANSFALAVFMSMLLKRTRFTLFIFGWAMLNSFSRMYLGVHYPSDIFVGAVLGATIGGTLGLAAEYFVGHMTATLPARGRSAAAANTVIIIGFLSIAGMAICSCGCFN
ncbi:MAG: phosphatase PAP2 family protein [Muribaculaceae bacterium]|nr:phosphatase PAP2 family protein [Muribaculaceae bacterium]